MQRKQNPNRLRGPILAGLLAFLALAPAPVARGEVIQLADGRTLHGEIVGDETTDGALAVKVFATGGTIFVSWDHLLESRAKKLRVEYGIDIPEEEQVTVEGHVVTLITGKKIRGVAQNAGGGGPLVLKTRTGVQEYDRTQVADVVAIGLPILEAYTVDEAYQLRLAQNPPETSSGHFAMGDYAMRIGDFAHAKEHFELAQADADFAATSDGKTIDARLRRAGILLEAAGAREMAEKIQFAMYKKDWNEALEILVQLDGDYQDEQIRGAIGFDRLRTRVEKGRDTYFKSRVQRAVYDTMIRLMREKAREKKALRSDDDRPGAAVSGTLAGAKQWMNRELPTILWERVGGDLGLDQEEMDRFWKERAIRKSRYGKYGTGSFIVVKKQNLPGAKQPRRRPPGSRRGGDRASGPGAAQESKPLTDEEWYAQVKTGDRVKWMEAYFAENSGLFEIVRVDEDDLCSSCAGRGILTSSSVDGGESFNYCPQCNGAGKHRTVVYR